MAAAPEPHPVRRRVARSSLALLWGLLLLVACFVAVRYPHGVPPSVERLVGVGSGLFFAALGLHYLVFALEDGPALRDLAALLSFGRRDYAFLYNPWLLRVQGVVLVIAGVAIIVSNLHPPS